jgi:hypothetical protein
MGGTRQRVRVLGSMGAGWFAGQAGMSWTCPEMADGPSRTGALGPAAGGWSRSPAW